MSTNTRNQVLYVGFGKHSTGLGIPGEQVTKMMDENMEKAAEHGFDCTAIHLDPNDKMGAREATAEALKDRRWDGFAVGFGLRGIREMTALFEDIINEAREYAPQARLMFTTAPDGLFDAIKRVFPEQFQ